MQPVLQCGDAVLVRALLSNPPPSHARKGMMLLVYVGQAFNWPMIADGYDDGPTKMEAA